LPEKTIAEYPDSISFSLIGRPNVGKSSLANRLLAKSGTLFPPSLERPATPLIRRLPAMAATMS
jgi:ribosome biogenesis GTPase A